jgi:heme A synthase
MGFVTKGMRRPLNTAVLAMHKLIALAFAIYTVINVIGLMKNTPANAFIWAMVVVSALTVVALFATGAILSFEKPAAKFIHIIHNISTVLLMISVGLTYCIAVIKQGNAID